MTAGSTTRSSIATGSRPHPPEQHRRQRAARGRSGARARWTSPTPCAAGRPTVRGTPRRARLLELDDPVPLPELPATQKEALAYGVKAPIVYTSVALRDWTRVPEARRRQHQRAGGTTTRRARRSRSALATSPSAVARRADRPAPGPHPCAPGKPRKEQHRLGRDDLLTTSFETFERKIRDQLGRTLGGGGFDPARDIEAITVNRWPHGYTYNYNTLWIRRSGRHLDPRAAVRDGRQPFGRSPSPTPTPPPARTPTPRSTRRTGR